MRQVSRNLYLIAWTLMLEAWRRREIYAIVFITTVLLAGLRFVHFFNLEGIGKFYREISLETMNITTALTVILLAARQLPREFSNRTIYPLLAKPVSRLEFLLGKYIGVLLAGSFCYALFMVVFIVASVTLDAPMNQWLFVQSIYLQFWAFAVIAALVFFLSMLLNEDAAVTMGAILYLASHILMNAMNMLYDYMDGFQRAALIALHYIIPQTTLFDASEKVVHSMDGAMQVWGPLPAWTMWALTGYGAGYALIFLSGAFFLFRRRAL